MSTAMVGTCCAVTDDGPSRYGYCRITCKRARRFRKFPYCLV
jgi:hypothetical protein